MASKVVSYSILLLANIVCPMSYARNSRIYSVVPFNVLLNPATNPGVPKLVQLPVHIDHPDNDDHPTYLKNKNMNLKRTYFTLGAAKQVANQYERYTSQQLKPLIPYFAFERKRTRYKALQDLGHTEEFVVEPTSEEVISNFPTIAVGVSPETEQIYSKDQDQISVSKILKRYLNSDAASSDSNADIKMRKKFPVNENGESQLVLHFSQQTNSGGTPPLQGGKDLSILSAPSELLQHKKIHSIDIKIAQSGGVINIINQYFAGNPKDPTIVSNTATERNTSEKQFSLGVVPIPTKFQNNIEKEPLATSKPSDGQNNEHKQGLSIDIKNFEASKKGEKQGLCNVLNSTEGAQKQYIQSQCKDVKQGKQVGPQPGGDTNDGKQQISSEVPHPAKEGMPNLTVVPQSIQGQNRENTQSLSVMLSSTQSQNKEKKPGLTVAPHPAESRKQNLTAGFQSFPGHSKEENQGMTDVQVQSYDVKPGISIAYKPLKEQGKEEMDGSPNVPKPFEGSGKDIQQSLPVVSNSPEDGEQNLFVTPQPLQGQNKEVKDSFTVAPQSAQGQREKFTPGSSLVSQSEASQEKEGKQDPSIAYKPPNSHNMKESGPPVQGQIKELQTPDETSTSVSEGNGFDSAIEDITTTQTAFTYEEYIGNDLYASHSTERQDEDLMSPGTTIRAPSEESALPLSVPMAESIVPTVEETTEKSDSNGLSAEVETFPWNGELDAFNGHVMSLQPTASGCPQGQIMQMGKCRMPIKFF